MKKTALLLVLAIIISAIFICPFSVTAENTPEVALDGVQIRLTENHGLRFIAKVSGKYTDYDEVGMLALPAEYLNGELTLRTAGVKKISSTNPDFKYFEHADNYFRYTLCFTEITHDMYERQYVVRPYVKYTENGSTKTVYGTNSDDYILSTAQTTLLMMEKYADDYTGEESYIAEYEKLDALYTNYNEYLQSLIPPVEEPEPEEPEEPETYSVVTLNEWYWRLGTLGSTNGVANLTNTKRIFTPNYIPVENTTITFDGASGIKYIVMEYDKDRKWLSTSGWITAETYVKKNETAAYYRCVLTDDSALTVDDIKEMSAHLTIKTPPAKAYRYLDVSDWAVGTISGTNVVNTASTTRVYTPDYVPVEDISIAYNNGSDNTYTSAFVVLGYKADKTFIDTAGDTTAASFSKWDKIPDAAYVRFVLKLKSGKSVTADTVGDYSKWLTVGTPSDVTPAFLEIGSIDASGEYAASTESAYINYYMPINVTFDFDTESGYTYKVSYYDSAKAFISQTEALTSESSPEAPEGAQYFRLSVDPSMTVTDDNIALVGSAFDFFKSIELSDWALGTISTDGTVNESRAQRVYTPVYFPTEDIKISYDTTNAEVSKYVVLGYDADKVFIASSGDNGSATFEKADGTVKGSAYYRFALKCNSDVTVDTIGNFSDCLSVSYKALPIEGYTETITEDVPVIESLYDEGLLFRSAFSTSNAGELASGVGGIGGMCIAEDEVWVFAASDTGTVGYGLILRYKLDLENKTLSYIGAVKHDFGHANSADYNEENGCLTLGNGSSKFWNGVSSTTDNEFYVYKDAYNKIKNGAEMLSIADEDCITCEWSETGITYMTKLNSCWYGNSSVLVNANNNGHIYKISLGTGSRVLKYGTADESAADGEFNGTWDIIKHYAQSDNYDNAQATGYNGQGYDQCNQGNCYHDGELILNLGHDGVYMWRCLLNADGTITRSEFHKYMVVNGAAKTGSVSGVDRIGDYIVFTNGGYINVYENEAIK